MFCRFLEKWPSLEAVKKARQKTLLNFLNTHHSRYVAVNEKRVKEIKSATALTDDLGIIEPNQLMIEVLVPQLKCLLESIERLDKEIKQRYKKQNE